MQTTDDDSALGGKIVADEAAFESLRHQRYGAHRSIAIDDLLGKAGQRGSVVGVVSAIDTPSQRP
jgi:hypothetical protein